MVITQTKSSDPKDDDNEDDNDKTEDGAPHMVRKPLDQVREERMRDLQAEIAFHHRHGQYDEALERSKELLEASLRHFDERHPVTASAFNNVGLMHKMLGNFVDSRDMYHESLKIYGEIVGSDHASYAAALNNLGNLFRTQSQMDDTLSALERLQMNEAAVEYFEEALRIRQDELGHDHPHTVTSHTNLGAAMASMLLQEQANRSAMYRQDKKSTRKQQGSSSSTDAAPSVVAPLPMTKSTKSRWEAAEQHLRTALNTAVQNPRGEKVMLASNKKDDTTTTTTTTSSTIPQILTLSAAGAAQNLAVFLKSKADMARKLREDTDTTTTTTTDTDDMYAEALRLYQGSLSVRTNLLSVSHPDTVTTKFSLAELLASAFDNEEDANQLRQEILDAYSVEEKDEPPAGSGSVS